VIRLPNAGTGQGINWGLIGLLLLPLNVIPGLQPGPLLGTNLVQLLVPMRADLRLPMTTTAW